jgi:beta-xylosidase
MAFGAMRDYSYEGSGGTDIMTSFLRISGLCACVLVSLLGSTVATAAAPMPSANPDPKEPLPLQHGLHLTDIQVHDPWIVADQATHAYYLYTSASAPMTVEHRGGTLMYKSPDLVTWEGPYTVFVCPDGSWADPPQRAWAPEVHAYKGKYYLLTTLHNPDHPIPKQNLDPPRPTFMRSTIIAVSDSLAGPFKMLKLDAPTAPANFMILDGTLFVDKQGLPWMVYAHEWGQKGDGTMEAVPLRDDLSDAAGAPIHLFKASDAPWINERTIPNARISNYVTDGPELFRTKTGKLLMLWSSYESMPGNYESYVETVARSTTGELKGPWVQLPPLVENDSGHGMLFHSFDGKLLLVVLQPFQDSRSKIYEIEDRGDSLRVVKYRADLSGPPLGPQRGRSRN